MSKKAFILDLDDTLFIAKPLLDDIASKNHPTVDDYWQDFHNRVDQEELDWNCYSVVVNFIKAGWRPIISTARSEEIYRKTFAHIKRVAPELAEANPIILMRNYDDYRPSEEIKEEHLRHLMFNLGYDIQVVLDDDKNNIAMFRKHGIPTIKWVTYKED